jgi:hypothetical protein
MSLRTLAIGIASGLIGLCVGLAMIGPAYAQKKADAVPEALQIQPSGSGRYQGAIGQSHFCLFDTVTGQVWTAREGGAWTPAIQPVKPVAGQLPPDGQRY